MKEKAEAKSKRSPAPKAKTATAKKPQRRRPAGRPIPMEGDPAGSPALQQAIEWANRGKKPKPSKKDFDPREWRP